MKARVFERIHLRNVGLILSVNRVQVPANTTYKIEEYN